MHLQSAEIHQPGDFRRHKALYQLLDKLRMTEQFLVAGIVVLTGHGALPGVYSQTRKTL